MDSIPKTVGELITVNNSLWRAATRCQFLDEIKQGTLPSKAFAIWLVQDYHFASNLLTAQSLMLSCAPRADQALLIGGLVALENELAWFEANAKARDLDLAQPLPPTCRAYSDFLLALPRQSYVTQITSLWAIERAYLDGWMTTLPCHSKYSEFAERWTKPAFHNYVNGLEAAANTSLEHSSDAQRENAHDYFRWVARYERDFWRMAYAGPSD
jgi:thiaminase/transcriptional activator TenA